ncbi:hypothetical protein MMC21_003307 [Puttea exsequens]|nr:hypothetical protein [Puttea exsequens]
MTPKKPHHAPHISHPSDSDNNLGYLSADQRNVDTSLLPLPSKDRTNYEINLSVLQRLVPSTLQIEFTIPYAVLYLYNPDDTENKEPGWEKTGVEGTMFVAQLDRNGYAVVVLNRKGLENFVLRIQGREAVELTEEYIILPDFGEGGPKMYGLWIFEEPEGSTRGLRDKVGRCIVQCAERVEESNGMGASNGDIQRGGQSNGHTAKQQPTTMPPGSPDLMALLRPPQHQAQQNENLQQSEPPPPPEVAAAEKVNILDLFRKAGYRPS